MITRRLTCLVPTRPLSVSTVVLSGPTFPLRDEDEVRRALARLGETVGQVLEETGLFEEQLTQMFDVRRRHTE